MSDIHIQKATPDGINYVVVFHVPVPNTNNNVGVNHRTALLNSGLGGTTILKDGDGTNGTISAAEKTSITNGSVYEIVVGNYPAKSGGTSNAQLRATVRALYASENNRFQAELLNILSYFGHTDSAA